MSVCMHACAACVCVFVCVCVCVCMCVHVCVCVGDRETLSDTNALQSKRSLSMSNMMQPSVRNIIVRSRA